jgi:subtilisin family serine protease
MGFPEDDTELMPVVVELNLRHEAGLPGAESRFGDLYEAVTSGGAERRRWRVIANTYVSCDLSVREVSALVGADAEGPTPAWRRAIYRVWPDFQVHPLTDRSVATVKGDAAQRSFAATGKGITWAVIDSGIDARHPHFASYDTLGGDAALLHRDFTQPDGESDPAGPDQERAAQQSGAQGALTDGLGHGTHVAGIIAGRMPASTEHLRVVQHVDDKFSPEGRSIEDRPLAEDRVLAGVAPHCKLVSLKVFDSSGRSRSTALLKALQYVREEINGNGKLLRIQGVNMSLGYEFDAEWFACGQSPLCVEVDRLVRSGVVVVVAAGNTGYGTLNTRERQSKSGMDLTINDPGNAALAITVGATHRDMPHTYGVSFFSSKGPTGDGRLKPDLVAPGEAVTSCAAGHALEEMCAPDPPAAGMPYYTDQSGTSMAAPHVSGAIAAFLSIRREFIGRPEEVKRIFLESATSLGRERYFEGHGLVDLMRAIQSV